MTGTLPDSRRWWRRKARQLKKVLEYTKADYDAVEEELKQLIAERAQCTCNANNKEGQP